MEKHLYHIKLGSSSFFFLCGGGWDTRRLKGLCLELDLIGLLSDVTVVLLILSRFN